MPFLRRIQQLSQAIVQELKDPQWTADAIADEFSAVIDPLRAQLALPCFKIAESLGEAPEDFIARLSSGLQARGISPSTGSGYLYFDLVRSELFHDVVTDDFAPRPRARAEKVLLEYGSPNLARGVGLIHFRGALLGETLCRALTYCGDVGVRVNFLGDSGQSFARLMAAFQTWGDVSHLQLTSFALLHYLALLSLRFEEEAEHHPEYHDYAKKIALAWEQKEPTLTVAAEKVRDNAAIAVTDAFFELGIHFDVTDLESRYIHALASLIETVKKKLPCEESDGNLIVSIPGVKTPAVIQRKDGGTLYLMRDLAAVFDRYNRFAFDRMLFVVSQTHSLHFELLFGVLRLLKAPGAEHCEHVRFAVPDSQSVKLQLGGDSEVVLLQNLVAAVKEFAESMGSQSTLAAPLSDSSCVARVLLSFLMVMPPREEILRVDSIQDSQSLHAAWAVIQTRAQCSSILNRARSKGAVIDTSVLEADGSEEEWRVLAQLAQFRLLVRKLVIERNPALLADYLIETAKATREYSRKYALSEQPFDSKKLSRLALVSAAMKVLDRGLSLLGTGMGNDTTD